MTVRSEVEKIVLTYANSQGIPVAIENVPFTKPASTTGKYLEIVFIGSSEKTVTVDGKRSRETGVVQINCCVPQGTGPKIGDDLANAISSLFPVVPKVGTISIERPANISQAITREDGYRVIPVRISYRQEKSL